MSEIPDVCVSQHNDIFVGSLYEPLVVSSRGLDHMEDILLSYLNLRMPII